MKIKRNLFCVLLILTITLLISSTTLAGKSISKCPGVTVMTLVKGAPIHGANGLYFGPDGNLYVASFAGNEIIKMDPNSGRILDRIGIERGVLSPDDLTFGPDGSLYWTELLYGQIGKLDPEGNSSVIPLLGQGVNPITFSPDNQWLYSARDFLGKGLFRIRPNGTEYTDLLPNLVNFNGFDFGPDGWLYGPLFSDGKVVKVDVNARTPPLDPDADVVDVLTGIAPSAVKFDSQGRLYTNDNLTGKVLRYDLFGTGKIEVLATLPFSMDNLAIDSRNHVFVSSDADGYIARILPNENYILLSPGGMIYPSGVAVLLRGDGGESVYVGDMWSLREFDGRTGKARSVESAGVSSSGLAPLLFSAAKDETNLIVSSSINGIVQIWNPASHSVEAAYPDPAWPINAIRFQGDLVVTELFTGKVMRWTSGGPETLAQLYGPVGLATNGNDLWAADYSLGMVFRIGSPSPVAMNLDGPEGLAYYPPDGSLLVVESNAGRLSKIDPATGAKTIVAEGLQLGNHWLTGLSPTSDAMIDGVAVGPSGTIYVTGNKANVLYRIQIHP